MKNAETTKSPINDTDRVFAELALRYRDDPVFFVEHCLGHYTWSGQRDILNAVRDHERVAVRACHGISKTFTAAEIVAWFFDNYPDSKVITAAPTGRQVRELLWSEIGRLYQGSRYKLTGECQTVAIRTDKPEHSAIGFSTDNQSSAEGFHAPRLLFVLDEAKGIPEWLWSAIDGASTGGMVRWLVISTTDGVQMGSRFERVFNDTKNNDRWVKIHLKAKDSPFVSGEKFQHIVIPDLKRPDRFHRELVDPAKVPPMQMASQGWINNMATDYGPESVMYLTKVEGEIVDASADGVILLSQVYKMFENHSKSAASAEGAVEIGADIARGGDDDCVFFKRKGMRVVNKRVITTGSMPQKAKLVYVASELMKFADQDKTVRIKVDDTGLGGGVTDILQDSGYNVVPVNFGGTASDPDKYASVASEMWFTVAQNIDGISCPEDQRLQNELVGRRQKNLDKKGRRMIEPKDEYKKRMGRSPDVADGFLLCFYEAKLENYDKLVDKL